jgi:hypothetical protein
MAAKRFALVLSAAGALLSSCSVAGQLLGKNTKSRVPAGTTTPAELHRQFPGVLIIIDNAIAVLDSTPESRVRRDSLLVALTGRIIASIEMFPPGDSVALKTYGSRARNGLIIITTRP